MIDLSTLKKDARFNRVLGLELFWAFDKKKNKYNNSFVLPPISVCILYIPFLNKVPGVCCFVFSDLV